MGAARQDGATGGLCRCVAILNDEESPGPGDTLEVVLPTVTKIDIQPCD